MSQVRFCLMALFVTVTICGRVERLSAQPQASENGYSSASLRKYVDELLTQLDPKTKSALKILGTYPDHQVMLIVRAKDGQAELHEQMADVILVLDGSATLCTGGEMVDGGKTGEGELRGSGIVGASKKLLSKGDFVHVSANVPHQFLVRPGVVFSYLVVKVREVR